MRILDVELQSVLNEMSQEELDNLENTIENAKADVGLRRIGSVVESINPFFNGDFLAEQVKSVVGDDRAAVIDDEKAYNDITDVDDKLREEGYRVLSFGMYGKTVRKISFDSVRMLIRRAKIMNRGRKFSEKFTKMTSKEIHEYRMYNKSWRGPEDKKNDIDEKYGINFYDKCEIFNIMQAKAFARELVADIAEDKFYDTKNIFEDVRNHPKTIYTFHYDELKGIFSYVFGENQGMVLSSDLALADFAEAFDERAKEIERKKNSKANIFKKIKNFFTRKKKSETKALPEGNSNDTRDNYLKSIKVDQKGMKRENNIEKSSKDAPSKDEGPSI